MTQIRDLERERLDLIEIMEKNIPQDLMKQIDFFAKVFQPHVPELKVWTSSTGTTNATQERNF